ALVGGGFDPPDLGGLPAGEQEVIRRATANDLADRFGTATEFVRALRQSVRDLQVTASGVLSVLPPAEGWVAPTTQHLSGPAVPARRPVAGGRRTGARLPAGAAGRPGRF